MGQHSVIRATRYHDISCGHRVVGHENKCRWLHGHNYRIHFYCEAEELDKVGRVIDFGVIKSRLCMWLEDNWDHKMLLWGADPFLRKDSLFGNMDLVELGVQVVGFNPTAENMAKYLLEIVGEVQLRGTGVKLVKVIVEETRKCSAEVEVCDLEKHFPAKPDHAA